VAPSCTRCPALVASRSRIVPGRGDLQSRILFVGEAPGRHGADRSGVPFVGDRSGKVFSRILAELDLAPPEDDGARRRCFVTNVVRCCPPANRTPTPREITACAPFLDAELTLVDPLIIVPVGLVALRAIARRLLAEEPVAIRPLHALPIPAGGRWIVPLVHPARISRAQIAAFCAAMRPLLAELGDAGFPLSRE
jgi:DNA polymerase